MIEEENVDGAQACKKCGKVNKEEVAMNELPVIGSLHLPTNFWDCHGANIVIHQKGKFGKRLFGCPKKQFWRELMAFLPQFYHKWIDMLIMLIQGKCKFLLELPQNM